METRATVYLEFDDAVWLHLSLMKEWNEVRFGVDHRSLIESALARPKQSALYENADIVRQSATLCFGLIKNHPWLGGNKRTATHLTEVFLDINGTVLITKLPKFLNWF